MLEQLPCYLNLCKLCGRRWEEEVTLWTTAISRRLKRGGCASKKHSLFHVLVCVSASLCGLGGICKLVTVNTCGSAVRRVTLLSRQKLEASSTESSIHWLSLVMAMWLAWLSLVMAMWLPWLACLSWGLTLCALEIVISRIILNAAIYKVTCAVPLANEVHAWYISSPFTNGTHTPSFLLLSSIDSPIEWSWEDASPITCWKIRPISWGLGTRLLDLHTQPRYNYI